MCFSHLLLQEQVFFSLHAHHLLHKANFSTACVNFVQVILDLLQVGDTIKATQLEDELEETANPREASHQTIRALKRSFDAFSFFTNATIAKDSCEARDKHA